MTPSSSPVPNAGEEPVISIHGERVSLGPLRRDLLPRCERWMNDFAVSRTAGLMFYPLTREAIEGWYQQVTGRQMITFTVYERASLRPVGVTGFAEIERHHRTAEYWINLGERDCWGKGYGTEVTRLMLEYGFSAVGLENIMLKVHSFNERAIALYERCGFRLIGRRRRAIRAGERAYDDVYMDCIAEEFHGTALRGLFPAE